MPTGYFQSRPKNKQSSGGQPNYFSWRILSSNKAPADLMSRWFHANPAQLKKGINSAFNVISQAHLNAIWNSLN
jgi:hypothetical protein